MAQTLRGELVIYLVLNTKCYESPDLTGEPTIQPYELGTCDLIGRTGNRSLTDLRVGPVMITND